MRWQRAEPLGRMKSAGVHVDGLHGVLLEAVEGLLELGNGTKTEPQEEGEDNSRGVESHAMGSMVGLMVSDKAATASQE